MDHVHDEPRPLAKQMRETGKLPWTPPFDPRFPNTNQKRNCVQNYLDFHRCEKKLGEGDDKCRYYEKAYKSLCPKFWYEKWDDQREEGIFPVKI